MNIQSPKIMKSTQSKILMALCLLVSFFSSNPAYSSTHQQFFKSVLPNSCHFSGNFTQNKKVKALPNPLISNGGFLYSCKLGLVWETRTPIQESLIFSTDKLNFVVKNKSNAENLESVQHDFLAKLLLSLMAADLRVIEKEFALKMNGPNLMMIPKSSTIKKAIQSVVLAKANGQKNIVITITDKNQQVTRINTQEAARYPDDKGFKKRCASLKYNKNACALLLDPERIMDN